MILYIFFFQTMLSEKKPTRNRVFRGSHFQLNEEIVFLLQFYFVF